MEFHYIKRQNLTQTSESRCIFERYCSANTSDWKSIIVLDLKKEVVIMFYKKQQFVLFGLIINLCFAFCRGEWR